MIGSRQKLLMGAAGVKPAFNPEAGLTLTREIAPTSSDESITLAEKEQPAVFACDVNFGVTLSVGLLAEFGGRGDGAWVGIESSSPANFRVRAGNGGVLSPDNNSAFLDIGDFPQDGEIHTVVWDFRVSVGRVRLWIDGVFKGEAFTTSGGDLGGDAGGAFKWAGGNNSAYINATSSAVCAGESTLGWYSPTGASNLRFYANQLVIA